MKFLIVRLPPYHFIQNTFSCSSLNTRLTSISETVETFPALSEVASDLEILSLNHTNPSRTMYTFKFAIRSAG
jgi:hypothetical protein